MTKVVVGKDTAWRKGMTVADLLCELTENRPLVGVVISGRYVPRSQFGKLKIPDQGEVRFIP